MRLQVVKSIGFSMPDSLAFGCGLRMVAVGETDIFGEAARSPQKFIEVDFLTGSTSGGQPSPSLARAVALYAKALPGFCAKHDGDVTEFRELSARFFGTGAFERIVVMVANQQGRRSVAEYAGFPRRRVKVLDHLGRSRPK